jgi:hypothetical protein
MTALLGERRCYKEVQNEFLELLEFKEKAEFQFQ